MPTKWNNLKSVERRKLSATVRQENRNLLTAEQQLAKLDAKFGVGQGARKERSKLRALLRAVKFQAN